jgi:hypothetical protein
LVARVCSACGADAMRKSDKKSRTSVSKDKKSEVVAGAKDAAVVVRPQTVVLSVPPAMQIAIGGEPL